MSRPRRRPTSPAPRAREPGERVPGWRAPVAGAVARIPRRGELRPLRDLAPTPGLRRSATTGPMAKAPTTLDSLALNTFRPCRNVPVNACICDRPNRPSSPYYRLAMTAAGKHQVSRAQTRGRRRGPGRHPGRGRRRRGLHHDCLRRAQRQGPTPRRHPPSRARGRRPAGLPPVRGGPHAPHREVGTHRPDRDHVRG